MASTPSKDSGTITLKTETEHILYNRLQEERGLYLEERQQRRKLEGLVDELKNQVEVLQQQLKCLTETKSSKRPTTPNMETSPSHCQTEYVTDEEELAKETEWIRAKSRKKRKMNTPPTQSPPQNDNTKATEKSKKVPPPPPIVVDGVKNYQDFYDFLSLNQPAGSFTIKMLSGDSVKLNAFNEDSYRGITKTLSDNNSLWHTYENKQERPIRVMVKKLPFTCSPERIVEDLKGKGYKIEEAVNKLSWKSKEPLNMFMLTFNNKEDISKVYEIKSILGCMVEIQPLKTTKLIPQCKRCQVYGHTHKYCSKEPRCVKCIGKHLTINCKKTAEEKPKCVHCGDAHPANYRGCMIAKEMQRIRSKGVRKPVSMRPATAGKQTTTIQHPSTVNAMSSAKKSFSYAQAAAKSTMSAPVRHIVHDNTNNNKLDEIIKLMTSFDARLQKIEHSNKTAISKSSK